jgi:hypothetical protein
MNTELATRQNGIAKAEKAMAPNLTEREVKVINASRSPHCSRLIRQGDPSVNKILINALRGLHTIAGYSKPEKSDPETVAEIVVAMTDVIKRHTWLRVRELDRVINQGLIGEYGDFYGLNARVLNGWIKTYFEAERAAAIKKQVAFEQDQQVEAEKAREEANRKFYTRQQRERFISHYRQLQEKTGPLSWRQVPDTIDIGNNWYERFWKAGLQRVDAETFSQYVSEAQKELKGDELSRHLTGEGLLNRAKAFARGRVLREKVAQMLNSDQDIEEVLDFVGL